MRLRDRPDRTRPSWNLPGRCCQRLMAVNLAHNPGARRRGPPVYPIRRSGWQRAQPAAYFRGHVHRAHDAGLAAEAVRYAARAAASPGAHGRRRRSAGEGRRQRPVPFRRRHDGSRCRGPALPQLAAAVHARPRDRRLGRRGRRGRERLLARTAGDPRGHALGWHLRVLPRGAGQQLRRRQRRARLRARWRACALRAPDEPAPAHCASRISTRADRRSPGGRRGDSMHAVRRVLPRGSPAARVPSSSAPAGRQFRRATAAGAHAGARVIAVDESGAAWITRAGSGRTRRSRASASAPPRISSPSPAGAGLRPCSTSSASMPPSPRD